MSDAGEAGVAPLGDGDVPAGELLVDVRRNEDGHTSNLLLHLLCVDLTHVAVLVFHSHISAMSKNNINGKVNMMEFQVK